MNISRRHHTVPEHYLRLFSYDEKMIYVFDKKERKIYTRNIEKIVERNFYNQPSLTEVGLPEDWFEKTINQEADNHSGAILPRLIKELNSPSFVFLTPEYKDALCITLYWQFLRTPDFRKRFQKSSIESFRKAVMIEKAPIERESTSQLLGEFLDERGCASHHMGFMLRENHFIETVNLLKRHIWIVYKSGLKVGFCTSDTPVILDPTDVPRDHFSVCGIATPGIIVVYPLSAQYLLAMYERSHHAETMASIENECISISNRLVRRFNRLQAFQAARFVYSRDGDL